MPSQGAGHLKAIIGANIRFARSELGLTQAQLAATLSIESTNVSRWERGAVMPSTANLAAVALATGRDIGWFHTDHERAAA